MKYLVTLMLFCLDYLTFLEEKTSEFHNVSLILLLHEESELFGDLLLFGCAFSLSFCLSCSQAS
jgi:hypothetical protein